ncbi:hypothetical protein SAMN05216480_10328 [Pustulibacterium marinum]|uniref:SmpA / OmlA family protein n=1 Tax=Pustulibacterium marinum TaxID=1224947 RepID=A0A1I7G0I7_9FLAO|nr:hypothetical protein [Pustulibacterium marinum]SFU41954.1 hypothetical protein SAMN05216480_10328 [Pustulibacterium marinum]
MKKITILLVTAVLCTSCILTKAPMAQVGMTEEEFTESTHREELVELEENWAVYRVFYGYESRYVKYYYFKNHKLVRMDTSERNIHYHVRRSH